MTLFHRLTKACLITLALGLPFAAAAHEAGTVEISIDAALERSRVELDLQDLDFVVGLSERPGASLRKADVQSGRTAILRYVAERFAIRECAIETEQGLIGVRDSDPPRLVVDLPMSCAVGTDRLHVGSRLLDEFEHYRTVIRHGAAGAERLQVLSGDEDVILLNTGNRAAGFGSFVAEGVHHILLGLDHLVFLLLLVLPVAMAPLGRRQLWAVTGLVTAFTAAHSLTLVLSTWGHLSLPAAPVEVIIAGSILLVALANLLGKVEQLAWPLAFSFGLIHGFGFAGAFRELAVGSSAHWSDLLAFNLGVEVGQLAVVAIALGLFQVLRQHSAMRVLVVPGSSVLAAGLSVFWIVERL